MKDKRRDEITFVEARTSSSSRPPSKDATNDRKQIDTKPRSGMGSMLLSVERRDSESGPRVSGKAMEIMERKKAREEAAARKRAEKMEEAARAKADAAQLKSRALADRRAETDAAAVTAAAAAAQRQRDADRAAADKDAACAVDTP